MAKINTLNLSGYKIENVFCFTTFDFTLFRGSGTPVHGIIGSNLMERYKVTIDFQSNLVVFSTDLTPLTPSENGLLLTFRNHPVNNAPLIKFKINQDTIEGMIDTGQSFPLVLPLSDFDLYEKDDFRGVLRSKGVMIRWPLTTPLYNYLTRLKSFEIDGLKITGIVCIFAELPPMLSMPLIGSDFLSQFKMIINYPGDEMMLIRHSDSRFKNNLFSLGLHLNLSENGELLVEGVWENSPADDANIRVGDSVTAFNGEKVTAEKLAELLRMIRDDRIKSIILEVKNQKKTRKVKLHKAMLF
jgi:hypothetical protein